MISVMNRKVYKGDGIYIGRNMPGLKGSVLGNPFKLGRDGNREEVIEKYLKWLRWQYVVGGAVKQELLRLVELSKVGDLVLICWCHPEACHGDVLKDVIQKLASRS